MHQFPGVGKYCRVDRVPSVVLLVNQKAMHYQGILSTGKLKDFVSSALSDYINEVNCTYTYICCVSLQVGPDVVTICGRVGTLYLVLI